MMRASRARALTRRNRITALALCAAALAWSPPARAQSGEPTLEISLGYYEPTFDTKVRLDSTSFGLGTQLDLERDLGLENSAKELRAEVGLRISNRNRLVLDHVAFDRSGKGSLSQSIRFGDVVYAGNADVSSRVETQHTSASWRFSVVKGLSSDIAVSLGASWLDLKAELSGVASATTNGVPSGSAVIAEKGEASGPIPLVGLHGRWWLLSSLRLAADVRYFDVNDFQGWSGSIVDYGARVDYFFTPNLALGVGYGGTRLEADFSDSNSSGRIDYSFDGFRLTGTVAF